MHQFFFFLKKQGQVWWHTFNPSWHKGFPGTNSLIFVTCPLPMWDQIRPIRADLTQWWDKANQGQVRPDVNQLCLQRNYSDTRGEMARIQWTHSGNGGACQHNRRLDLKPASASNGDPVICSSTSKSQELIDTWFLQREAQFPDTNWLSSNGLHLYLVYDLSQAHTRNFHTKSSISLQSLKTKV